MNSRPLGAATATVIVGRILGPTASWAFLPTRDVVVVSIPGRSVDIEGAFDSDALTAVCYRLLGNRAISASMPENAVEYEAAANGRRLL